MLIKKGLWNGWSTNILLDQVYSNECPLSALKEIEVIS